MKATPPSAKAKTEKRKYLSTAIFLVFWTLLAFLSASMITGCTILHPHRWPTGSMQIVLTFDDGPNPRDHVSARLLDVLAKHQVKATFCYIGKNVEANPAIVARAHREGHALAIHTYSHAFAALFSTDRLIREIDRSEEAIRAAVADEDCTLTLFRPPWGLMTPPVRRAANLENLKIAHITLYVRDVWTQSWNSEKKMAAIKKKLLRNRGGAIVLHEMRYQEGARNDLDKSWLPAAVDDLIAWAKAEGFTFAGYQADRPLAGQAASR